MPADSPSASDTAAVVHLSTGDAAADRLNTDDIAADRLNTDDIAADRSTDRPAESQDPMPRGGAWVQLMSVFLNSVLPVYVYVAQNRTRETIDWCHRCEMMRLKIRRSRVAHACREKTGSLTPSQ